MVRGYHLDKKQVKLLKRKEEKHMESKNKAYRWSALFGILTIVAQIAFYYYRFGTMPSSDFNLLHYLIFFLGGVAGGVVFIFFWKRSKTLITRLLVLVFFLAAAYPSLTAMVSGGLLGPIGNILLPLFYWIIITGIGYLIGRWFSKRRERNG